MSNLNELRTMKEKEQLDPNELMENGLTRAQNEKIQKDSESLGGVMSIVAMVLALYCLISIVM